MFRDERNERILIPKNDKMKFLKLYRIRDDELKKRITIAIKKINIGNEMT